jgi:hypothetical protein
VNIEKHSKELEWYQFSPRVRLAGEYYGGVIAGIGAGILLLNLAIHCWSIPPYWGHFMVLGLILIPIGVNVAIHAHRRHEHDHDQHDK